MRHDDARKQWRPIKKKGEEQEKIYKIGKKIANFRFIFIFLVRGEGEESVK